MVQRRFRPFQQCVQNVRPMRSQRIAEIQVQGFSHSADPSVEKNMIAARPTTFSAGTKPTPPPLASGTSGKRLSALSSRSEEHTSELQSLMRISYAVFCLKKKITANLRCTAEQCT